MQFLQLQLQAADADGGCQVLRPFIRLHGGNLGAAVGDDRVHPGSADDVSVIINRQGLILVKGPLCDFREFLRALVRHGQAHRELGAHVGLEAASAGFLHIRALHLDGTVLQQFIDGLVQHIPHAVGAVRVLYCLLAVVLIALVVRLGDEIQRTGPAQLLQDGIGIADAGNLDIDPVGALLIDNGLRAVVLHALLQLRYGIAHVRGAGVFVPHHLIGDADAAGQVKPQIDVRDAAVALRIHAEDVHIGDAYQSQQDTKQYYNRLVLFHVLLSFL